MILTAALRKKSGFTLIELLVVMTIIAVLAGLALVSFQGTRKTARDGKRKADLEQIRSALEIYRTDVGSYPDTLSPLTPNYMAVEPKDPLDPTRQYSYNPEDDTYTLCAALEIDGSSVSGCGSCGVPPCTYAVYSPGKAPPLPTPPPPLPCSACGLFNTSLQSCLSICGVPPGAGCSPFQRPCGSNPNCWDAHCLGCFLAGTMITKVDEESLSSVPIEKIKIGDEVLSFNPDGEIKIAKVTKTHVAKANQIFVLSTKENEVKVTGEHPFLTEKGVFKKVKDLKVGEKIFVLCNDGLCEETILDKKGFNKEAEVYNLTVDGNNTFFAEGFAVHNKIIP